MSQQLFMCSECLLHQHINDGKIIRHEGVGGLTCVGSGEPVSKEALLRQRMGLAESVVIPPQYLPILPVDIEPLTGKDLEWAKEVAARYADKK
jgi:hypothetical protein